MTKWVIELGEFNAKFMPRMTIKGQPIENFLAEFAYPTKVAGVKIDVPSTLEGSPTNNALT